MSKQFPRSLMCQCNLSRCECVISAPTKKEYEEMDRIRFPFMFNQIKLVEDTLLVPLSKEHKQIIHRKIHKKENKKLYERISRLIYENQETFFDPIINREICPRGNKCA